MNQTIADKVREVIATVVNIDLDEVTPESDLREDLGADSIDIVEIAIDLEGEYRRMVDDGDFLALKTVKDVTEYIEQLIKTKPKN